MPSKILLIPFVSYIEVSSSSSSTIKPANLPSILHPSNHSFYDETKSQKSHKSLPLITTATATAAASNYNNNNNNNNNTSVGNSNSSSMTSAVICNHGFRSPISSCQVIELFSEIGILEALLDMVNFFFLNKYYFFTIFF